MSQDAHPHATTRGARLIRRWRLFAGRLIGWLERLVLAAGLLSNSWEILAAVIALKTVARFKELDQRDFAEYFLVGSLFSILWAIVVTGAWMLYDQH